MIALTLLLALAPTQDPDQVKITADFEQESLAEIVNSLMYITGVPIEVEDAARKKLESAKITFKIQDLTLSSAVRLLIRGQGVQMKVVDRKKIVLSARKE